MKLFKACIAMAAFAAIFVVPSAASASPELCETTEGTCHPVPVGTNIIATNVEEASEGISKITKMTLPGGGAVECATATITGKVTKNNGTEVQGEIETVDFAATPGTNHAETHCASPLGKINPTPSHTSNPVVHNNLASLPWCITANNQKDEFTLRGGTCAVPRAVTFALHVPSLALTCKYEKESVTGKYTTHPAGDAVLWIKEQEFKGVTVGNLTNSAFCPASGKLDMGFTLTTDEGGIEGAALSIQ